jgi:hypothetical protein
MTNLIQDQTYYPGPITDSTWYCPRHGCYPRLKSNDRCVVCERDIREAARIEKLWDSLAKDLLMRAKKRWKADHFAFKTNDPFTLTVEDVERVIPVDRKCPVLGIPLQIAGGLQPVFLRTKPPIWTWRLRRWGGDSSPALDKITPQKGYVPRNIAVMSTLANRIKNDTTDPEIPRRIAAWIEKHHFKNSADALPDPNATDT